MPGAEPLQLSQKRAAGAVAHRWGSVCPLSGEEQIALGLRTDEDDPLTGDTFVVRLRPGRTEIVDHIPGVAVGVAACPVPGRGDKIFVLDQRGAVHVEGRRHELSARAMVPFHDGLVLAGTDRVWCVSADGVTIHEGPPFRVRALSASRAGIAAVVDDGRLLWSAGDVIEEVQVHGAADADPKLAGAIGALAIDDDGRMHALAGRTVLAGDTHGLAPVAHASFDVHCVAHHAGKIYVGSRSQGLFVVDEGRLVALRPSIRAHTLSTNAGVLAAASDLLVAVADVDDELTSRDLAPFVRLAEERALRFVAVDANERPASL